MAKSKAPAYTDAEFGHPRFLLGFVCRGIAWYSGLTHVYRMIVTPTDKEIRKAPTFLLWTVGLHMAFFTIATNRYENRLDSIENRESVITTLLAADIKQALQRLPAFQRMSLPPKPELWPPQTVYESLFDIFPPRFQHAHIEQAKKIITDNAKQLTGVNLSSIDLRSAFLIRANLKKAKLQYANFHGALLPNANLSWAWLQGANLQGAWLVNANLSWARLMGANLQEADLRKAQMQLANLQGALLFKANLQGAKMGGANLQEADLRNANLENSIFGRPSSLHADAWTYSVPENNGANLRVIDLNDVFLQEAKLQTANLQGANLRTAELSLAQICQAEIDTETIFPDGSKGHTREQVCAGGVPLDAFGLTPPE